MVGLGAAGAVVGGWIKRHVPLLDRLNIPAPIIGGMVYALIALALRDRVVNLDADSSLRDLLQIAFFTTIGLNVRMESLRRGGPGLAWLLAAASVGAVLQNVLGVALSRAMGIDSRVGILAGSVSLTGGPATALVWGREFEKMGVPGATTVGVAAATFGITVSGLIGGYIGGRLIRRNKLISTGKHAAKIMERDTEGSLMTAAMVIAIAMGIGSLISAGFEALHIVLPATIGGMLAGALVRLFNDRFGWVRISQSGVNHLGQISLYLFIVMALVALKLWELAQLATPMLVLLGAQVVLCWLMCVTFAFWVMGRDYDAAVGSAGFCGFMLGITTNAVAVMEELVEKFGPAPRAFLVVPVVGGFLIDFVNSLLITAFANWVR
jgi:glutamate:Na+ symporter, ESS family